MNNNIPTIQCSDDDARQAAVIEPILRGRIAKLEQEGFDAGAVNTALLTLLLTRAIRSHGRGGAAQWLGEVALAINPGNVGRH
ncbi:hypothetical protein [Limibacillus sp. MBR-115]|jgi:hypothetical protein|uniref:hypothetical protein n=1 Tax=Limibacillus sp. MBR-115 TaxID=3156465 RepID=UPI00339A2FA8